MPRDRRRTRRLATHVLEAELGHVLEQAPAPLALGRLARAGRQRHGSAVRQLLDHFPCRFLADHLGRGQLLAGVLAQDVVLVQAQVLAQHDPAWLVALDHERAAVAWQRARGDVVIAASREPCARSDPANATLLDFGQADAVRDLVADDQLGRLVERAQRRVGQQSRAEQRLLADEPFGPRAHHEVDVDHRRVAEPVLDDQALLERQPAREFAVKQILVVVEPLDPLARRARDRFLAFAPVVARHRDVERHEAPLARLVVDVLRAQPADLAGEIGSRHAASSIACSIGTTLKRP